MLFRWFRARRGEKAMGDGLPVATTFIAEGCELSGELRFGDSVRVDGRVEGDLRAEGSVIVGASADVHASVRAECVIVFGQVEGDIRARRKITLHKSSRVRGELQSAGITIEEGASFKGSIAIGDADGSAALPAGAALSAAVAQTDSGSDYR
jgi:cytoskeletal protein CcmA (bactofilin family)